MFISMTDRGRLLDAEMREFAKRRLLFALSRFDSRISKVDLVVADEDGPRGGVDTVCRVSVSLKSASDVMTSEKDADLATCLSRAADRTGRAVSRSIERSRESDRAQRPLTRNR